MRCRCRASARAGVSRSTSSPRTSAASPITSRGPAADKFEKVKWRPGLDGCPTLPDCLALFECRRERVIEAGDHVVFIGRVERFTWRAGDPLVFSCGHYCLTATLPEQPRADIAPSDFADLML